MKMVKSLLQIYTYDREIKSRKKSHLYFSTDSYAKDFDNLYKIFIEN